MRRVLRWSATIAAGLVALLVLGLIALYFITQPELTRTYVIAEHTLPADIEQANVDRGRHLVLTVGFCQDCHAENLAGDIIDDSPLTGRLVAPNLTAGEGGVGRTWSDDELARAIRHGVDRDGTSLLVMPSNFYYHFSDGDLAAIIAFLRRLPRVDNDLPETQIGPLGRLFLLLDPSLLPARVIDHDAPRPPAPEPGVTVEYGRYLAENCVLCHGEDLSGRGGEGGGLNLTPAGDLGDWTEADFIRTLHTGITPEGEELDPELMPWQRIGQLTGDELRAIWLYLQSLPPVETPFTQENTR